MSPRRNNPTALESFIRNLFAGMNQRVAFLDAFGNSNGRALATIDSQASRLAKTARVQIALAELRQKAEDASIATVIERKQILTEIARGRLADFLVNPTPEKLRSAALQEITITETVTKTLDGKEKKTPKVTKVKLHDTTRAIAEINKMEGIYGDTPAQSGPVTNNIIVLTPDALAEVAALIQQIHSQAGPIELLPTGDGVFSADQGILRDG
jgi:hypothetical protein